MQTKRNGALRCAIGAVVFLCSFHVSEQYNVVHADEPGEVRGLWVTCEGDQRTLSSKDKILTMLERAADTHLNTIFLQVYRGNRAWYQSDIADDLPYRQTMKKDQVDLLRYTIAEAHKRNLEVHCWLNVFRIAKNREAKILKKLGAGALTVDGKGMSILDYPEKALPDGGYWLDPSNPEVVEYLIAVIKELLNRYPQIDGIHLDFLRYPYKSAYPGFYASRYGFGYTPRGIRGFIAWCGINPVQMDLTRENLQRWDDWRREQINQFVKKAYATCKAANPRLKFSVAVIAWADRAYLRAFQDWRQWMEAKTVDFVVPMNYTIDSRFARYITRQALNYSGERHVYIGLGAYLLGGTPEELVHQVQDCRELGAPGIVLFSYDSFVDTPELLTGLRKHCFTERVEPPPMQWKEESFGNDQDF